MQNINKALDKAWEKKSLKEIAEAPVSAFSGLAEWSEHLAEHLTFDQVTIWCWNLSQYLTQLARSQNHSHPRER
jgi:hypothetical protein